MEKKKVKVLGVKSYGFTNRETGEFVAGTTVWYQPYQTDVNDNVIGSIPVKANMKPEDYEVFKKYGVGDYYALLGVDFSGTRPQIKVKGFEPIKTP